jgi:predicted Zn-dependent peptidase
MLYKDVNLINTEIDMYRTITPEEIRTVAKKYLNPNQRLVLDYVPSSSDKAKKYRTIMKNNIYYQVYFFSLQAQVIPQPKPAAPPTIKIGKSSNFELKNGLKVMVVENHKLPQ